MVLMRRAYLYLGGYLLPVGELVRPNRRHAVLELIGAQRQESQSLGKDKKSRNIIIANITHWASAKWRHS